MNTHPGLGLVSMDYAKEYPVAMKAITEWIEKGLLKRKFHIVNGLDGAPGALPLLYSGGNTGKLWVLLLVPVDPVSYFASPESSGFLNTKPYPSYKSCNCLHVVICLLISMCCTRSRSCIHCDDCVPARPGGLCAWPA